MKQKIMSDAEHANRKSALAAIQQALIDIESNRGKEGYRMAYDKAIHILVAIKGAGLKLTRDSRAKQPKTLCEVFAQEAK